MKNLYCLYVAIDEYVSPVSPLKGCVRDLENLSKYVSERYQNQFQQHTKKLINQEATRQNIIDGFQHFQAAKDGDVCLFFYAGHGSRMRAPSYFKHLESDGMLETLVCHDSRSSGGIDLIDKELSTLIWEATKDKDIHFLTIMDCCHSGTNTRGELVNIRQAQDDERSIAGAQFYGFEHYKKDQDGNLTPPRGHSLSLSACRPDQTAKEVRVQGMPSGVFTHFLVKTLRENGGQLDYKSLLSKINTNVGQYVRDQSPQLESSRMEEEKFRFLSQGKWEGRKTYSVTYDRKMKQWVINAGAIHGMSAGTSASKTIFQIKDSSQKLEIKQVLPLKSVVIGMEDVDKNKVYDAELIQIGSKKLRIGLDTFLPPHQRQQLQAVYDDRQDWLFEWNAQMGYMDYLVRASENGASLTLPFDAEPLFESMKQWTTNDIKLFLHRINAVSKWRQTLELSNPNSSIQADEIEIQLYRLTEANNYADNAPTEEMPWNKALHLPYQKQDGNSYHPAFRMRIRNTGNRPLWVGTLYLQRDFAIHNQLLSKVHLAPEEEKWLEIRQGDYTSRTIEVQIEDIFLQKGIKKIHEYIKVLISTEELNTAELTQDPLPQEVGNKRGIVQRTVVPQSDWMTKEVELVLEYLE